MSYRIATMIAVLLLPIAAACSGPQKAADADGPAAKRGLAEPGDDEGEKKPSKRSNVTNCPLDMVRGGEDCRCPAFTPQFGEAAADFQTDQTLTGNFFGGATDAVVMGLEGCGDSPGVAVFDADGKYRAFSTFNIETCVVVPGEDGVDRLACLDERPIPTRGTEATFVHLLSFEEAAESQNDRVVSKYTRPSESCPTGTVKIGKDVELSVSDGLVVSYQAAKVKLPDGEDYCEWSEKRTPEFRSRVKTVWPKSGASERRSADQAQTSSSDSEGDKKAKSPAGDFCSKDNIRTVVGSAANEFGRCLNDGLESRTIDYGMIIAQWLITLDGTVRWTSFKDEKMLDVGVRHCLANAFRPLQFELLKGGVCIINYPFEFGPPREEK